MLAVGAELDLHEDRLDAAGEQLSVAWTTSVRLADPCWLAVTGRGLGLLAVRTRMPTYRTRARTYRARLAE